MSTKHVIKITPVNVHNLKYYANVHCNDEIIGTIQSYDGKSFVVVAMLKYGRQRIITDSVETAKIKYENLLEKGQIYA